MENKEVKDENKGLKVIISIADVIACLLYTSES